LIVHSLISLVTPSFAQINNAIAFAILLIVAVLSVIAIAIDRRALLVSALIYIGLVIAYALGNRGGGLDQSAIFFTTLVILGTFVIILGVGWQPLRRRLVALISPAIAAKLPPVPNSV
jgi:peptidoglycan/LPS O-acetylase OafA/YrhL